MAAVIIGVIRVVLELLGLFMLFILFWIYSEDRSWYGGFVNWFHYNKRVREEKRLRKATRDIRAYDKGYKAGADHQKLSGKQ